MEQLKVGRFITKKRKEQNLTQEQLAERLGVSNKTVSKWETGKCMPDYAVVKNLCEELNVSVSELMDGEETDDKSIRMYDEEQILDLLRRTQELEKQKVMLTGVVLIVMGIAHRRTPWVAPMSKIFSLGFCWGCLSPKCWPVLP